MFLLLKDSLKAFDNFKIIQKSVSSNVFWYVKECIFWKCIQLTTHGDKTQTLKKMSFWTKEKRYKKCPLFFFRKLQRITDLLAPTHYRFIFNLQFLYELKHKFVSLKLCFRFRFVFIKVYIFVKQKVWTLWLWKVMIPFKIKMIGKQQSGLLPDLWFLSCSKKF